MLVFLCVFVVTSDSRGFPLTLSTGERPADTTPSVIIEFNQIFRRTFSNGPDEVCGPQQAQTSPLVYTLP